MLPRNSIGVIAYKRLHRFRGKWPQKRPFTSSTAWYTTKSSRAGFHRWCKLRLNLHSQSESRRLRGIRLFYAGNVCVTEALDCIEVCIHSVQHSKEGVEHLLNDLWTLNRVFRGRIHKKTYSRLMKQTRLISKIWAWLVAEAIFHSSCSLRPDSL